MSCSRATRYLTVLICLSVAMSFAQQLAGRSDSKPEDQVAQLERDWLAADSKGDATLLRHLISDDFIGSGFDGQLLNKDDIIPDGNSPGGFAGATVGETTVRVSGDTGVLFGVINTADKPHPRQVHVTLVCQKTPQGWQMIAAQLTH
jgi:ketosteroid isomerase-like protein